MRGEREVVNREATDQRLDVSVVCCTLALWLRDGGDIRNEPIEIVACPVEFDVEKQDRLL